MAPPTGPRHIAGSENAVGLQLPQPVRRVGREEQPARSRNVNRGLDRSIEV